MNLLDKLPEKDRFLLWSEKNLDFCIELLDRWSDAYVIGYDIPEHIRPEDCPELRDHEIIKKSSTFPAICDMLFIDEAAKKLEAANGQATFDFADRKELEYWKRWMVWRDIPQSENVSLKLPDPGLSVLESERNIEYCIDALEKFPPERLIVMDSGKPSIFWFVLDVHEHDSAAWSAEDTEGYSYRFLQRERKRKLTDIKDFKPYCKGKQNAKLTATVYLWSCHLDISKPCSARYDITDKESRFEGENYCDCIRQYKLVKFGPDGHPEK